MAKDTIPAEGSVNRALAMKQKMHIQGSGAKAGQWVRCPASVQCKLINSPHVQELELRYAQDWAGRRAITDVSAEDYNDYMKAKIAGTVEQTRKPEETLAEKKARLGKTVLTPKTKKAPQNLTEEQKKEKRQAKKIDAEIAFEKAQQRQKRLVDERTEKDNQRKPVIQPTAPTFTPVVQAKVTDMVLWPDQYNSFLQVCDNNDITIITGNVASAGRMVGFGKKITVVRNLRLEGTKENINKTMNVMRNMMTANPASGYTM